MAEPRSQSLKYVLIGLGIAVGLGVCGVGSCVALLGGGAFFAYEQLDAPAKEARAFLMEASRGEADKALARGSKGFRARHSSGTLAAALKAQPGLSGAKDVTLPERAIQTDRARVAGTVTTESGQTGVALELVREGEAWRVDTVSIAGAPLE